MQPAVSSSCLQKTTSRSHNKPTEPSSNLSRWHIFSNYSPKFTSRIAQPFVAKLQTTVYSLQDWGIGFRYPTRERLFSPPKPQHPLKRSSHPLLQWVTKALSLRIKQRMKIQKQKVLNETCHGERHLGRIWLRREDNIRRNSSLLLSIRGWRRLVWEGYLETEILQRRGDVPSYGYTLVVGPQAAWATLRRRNGGP